MKRKNKEQWDMEKRLERFNSFEQIDEAIMDYGFFLNKRCSSYYDTKLKRYIKDENDGKTEVCIIASGRTEKGILIQDIAGDTELPQEVKEIIIFNLDLFV